MRVDYFLFYPLLGIFGAVDGGWIWRVVWFLFCYYFWGYFCSWFWVVVISFGVGLLSNSFFFGFLITEVLFSLVNVSTILFVAITFFFFLLLPISSPTHILFVYFYIDIVFVLHLFLQFDN
jgi:hypothetical protein